MPLRHARRIPILKTNPARGMLIHQAVQAIAKVDTELAARMVVNALADGSDRQLYEAAGMLAPQIAADLADALWPQL